MRFRSRLQPRRVGRVVRPASGPHGGRSPSCPAFCDTPPEPYECTLPGCGRRPRSYSSTLWRGGGGAPHLDRGGGGARRGEQRGPPPPIAQKVGPLVIDQIRCNDRGMLSVALLHQLEEDVGLLRFQIQIPKFVD